MRCQGMSWAVGDEGGKRGSEGEEQEGLHGGGADQVNVKGVLLQPVHPPQLPRQQSVLEHRRNFSITRPIHPYTFFSHCMYPSIHSPYYSITISIHPPIDITTFSQMPPAALPACIHLHVPTVSGRGREPHGGSGLPHVPQLGGHDTFSSSALAALPAEPGVMAEPRPCAPAALGFVLSSSPGVHGWVTAGVTNCLPKFLTKTPICAIYSNGSNLWRAILRSVIKHWSNNTLQDGLQDT